MISGFFTKGRVAVLLAAAAGVAAFAVYSVATASADGRTLDADFCVPVHTCMSLTFDGATVGTAERPAGSTDPDIALRPGEYWFSLTDNSNAHNYALRSCPGSDDICTASNPDVSDVQLLTPICNDPSGKCTQTTPLTEIDISQKLNLEHGTYRLFCQAPFHERAGMYVDIAVGGVGQVG